MENRNPSLAVGNLFSKKYSRLLLPLIAILVVLLVVSACGGSAATDAPVATNTGAGALATQASDVTPYGANDLATAGPYDKIVDNPVFFFSLTSREQRLKVVEKLITENGGSPDCDSKVSSVKVVQKKNDAGVWVEQWTMTICGKDLIYDITFTPDSSGGFTFEYAEAAQ